MEITKENDDRKLIREEKPDSNFIEAVGHKAYYAEWLDNLLKSPMTNKLDGLLTEFAYDQNGPMLLEIMSPSKDDMTTLLTDDDKWNNYKTLLLALPAAVFKHCTHNLHVASREGDADSPYKAIWRKMTENTDIVLRIAKVNDTNVSYDPATEEEQ